MNLISQLGDLQHWYDVLSAILNAGRTEGSAVQDVANGVGGVTAAGGLASAMGSTPNSSTGTPPSVPSAEGQMEFKDAHGSEMGYYPGTASHGGYSHPDGHTGDAYYPGEPIPPSINPSWPLYLIGGPTVEGVAGVLGIGHLGAQALGLGFDAYHLGHDLHDIGHQLGEPGGGEHHAE
ncbi:hypothetical protein GCM10009745_82950 [Kribbella yunnanensis]|uniref:Uncharacterized protein n=1 Tax=Kribbella yunnanensis TaxID=190194 RepID=A0ABN2JBR7_9ACTN